MRAIAEIVGVVTDYTVGTGVVLLHLLLIRLGRGGVVPLLGPSIRPLELIPPSASSARTEEAMSPTGSSA